MTPFAAQGNALRPLDMPQTTPPAAMMAAGGGTPSSSNGLR
jgi:hypothetical protein